MTYDSEYEDACETTVTADRARRFIAQHGCLSPADGWEGFAAQYGTRETYRGREVLDWLGY